jgi:hypothetical protein
MKRCASKFFFCIVLTLIILLWENLSYSAEITIKETTIAKPTIEEIIAKKDSFDGQEVMVSGKATNPKFKIKGGKNHTTFSIVGDSGGGHINVSFWGRPVIKGGQKVNVTGRYRKAKVVGRHVYYNEIEASAVK